MLTRSRERRGSLPPLGLGLGILLIGLAGPGLGLGAILPGGLPFRLVRGRRLLAAMAPRKQMPLSAPRPLTIRQNMSLLVAATAQNLPLLLLAVPLIMAFALLGAKGPRALGLVLALIGVGAALGRGLSSRVQVGIAKTR